MKDKKISVIYQYEDGDMQDKFYFVKNSNYANGNRYLFHADFYDILKGIDEDDETFSIGRIGINKRIKEFK